MSVAESVTYNSLTRTAWSIGLGYLILACHSGRGGWINEFLSGGVHTPSRMTYCAYLVHPVVMLSLTFSNLTLTKISYLVYAYTFIMFLVCAYAVAFVFSLLFEAPFINIDKLFITGAMKKKKD
ncbi:hypothetical protein EB796_007254 [Bugula neritina]|uniref:Nose resistant to fluoxetine protein 6 n=1 Tax=Bugula neritina TaxID=10212 RepID=A0A7J7K8A8_BUGNE|nr:hypothetical protein EB796_007254 [Bugula neritina]